jgi:cell division septation protein DedD
MKELKVLSLFLIMTFILAGCSASQETETETETAAEEEVYVFDEVKEPVNPPVEIYNAPNPPYFIVQIGAFTTKDKADEFARQSRNVLSNDIEVRFSNSVNLYVVQVTPYFKNRAEAESLRNKLWQMNDYTDAWILSVK